MHIFIKMEKFYFDPLYASTKMHANVAKDKGETGYQAGALIRNGSTAVFQFGEDENTLAGLIQKHAGEGAIIAGIQLPVNIERK